LPNESSNNPESPELDPQAKAEFMEEWGLEGGEMTDQQILMAINTGQLRIRWFRTMPLRSPLSDHLVSLRYSPNSQRAIARVTPSK